MSAPTAYCLPRNGCGITWTPKHLESSRKLCCPNCGNRSVRVEYVREIKGKVQREKMS